MAFKKTLPQRPIKTILTVLLSGEVERALVALPDFKSGVPG
jgi:hypothetical protein